ncbi:MAG TPA: M20/M25/M40 family metallo-hydrolase [Bacillota bacterium]
MERVIQYLRSPETRRRQVEDLKALCRIPSVSARGEMEPLVEAVRWVEERLRRIGLTTRLLDGQGGPPVLLAEGRGSAPRTLLFYNHADVQPPEPLDAWVSPPFEPEERDGFLYGRGTADNKGSLLSRVYAVEAFMAVHGRLPVNVKFLVEAEEESGSPHLDAVVQANRELLHCDAAIWENARKDDRGRPTAQLGNKGMVKIELRLRVSKTDFHSGFAPLYPNALWRLTWALSTLKGPDGKITIPGFYDRVLPFTEADAELCRTLPANVEEHKARMGLDRLLPGDDPAAVNRALFYEPTVNIQGIAGGYTGPGVKTVIPSAAMARLDCRLVMDQDPDEIFELVKRHLHDQGFTEIEAEILGRSWPRRTPPDHPFVGLVAETARETYGQDLVLLPTSGGTSPQYVFRFIPGLPVVNLGVSHMDCRQHAPNENIRIQDLYEGTEHIARILGRWAAA